MEKRKEVGITLGLIVLLLVLMIGVSYAAFKFTGTGTKVNTITSGNISMSFTETDNIISIDKALPTTDNTGVRTLEEGEYFDFTVTSNIKGNSYINYEISAKAIEGNTFDPNYVKLYLSKVNDDGTETSATKGVTVYDSSVSGTVPTYKEEVMANNNTGRPGGEMSLLTGTVSSQGEVTTKYRLRMYVAEEYNPQGDGGNLTFGVKVNVYGKNEAMTGPVIKARAVGKYFWQNDYRSNITTVVTKGDTTIPEGVIESWDMSVADDNSVIAYVEDDGSGEGTYKLTIGGNGKIIANPDMSYYFWNFSKLTNIDLSYMDTSIVTNMNSMFSYCRGLIELDLSKFDTSKVTDMSGMFSYCRSLIELDLSNLNISNVTDISFMFWGCSSLTELALSKFDTSKVTNMSSMFSGCTGLTTLDLSSFDTSKVTDMSNMFSSCSSLTELDLSKLDTSKVTEMHAMFSGCSGLTELDLSNLDTSNVTNMGYMFNNCSSLTELDLSNLDTSNVTNMQAMFIDCNNLNSLDLSDLETSKVTNMTYMFGRCRNLTNLNLSDFDTSKVKDMSGMFSNCSSLTTLDLTSFDTRNVTTMYNMFGDTTNLTQILVERNKWIIGSNTDITRMFSNSGVSQVTYV